MTKIGDSAFTQEEHDRVEAAMREWQEKRRRLNGVDPGEDDAAWVHSWAKYLRKGTQEIKFDNAYQKHLCARGMVRAVVLVADEIWREEPTSL